MLVFGSLVVVLKNPVSSAMSLVVSFIALAAIFITLDAFFIGIIQVLVYAGAVMVLFLFIIMLLNLREEKGRKFNPTTFLGGLGVTAFFVFFLVKLLSGFEAGKAPMPELAVETMNDAEMIGRTLFTNFTLPFQVVGVLILVATVGVVILSKRELK